MTSSVSGKRATGTPADLDQSRRQLAEVEARAAELRRQVEARAAEEAAARQQRLAEFDHAAIDVLADRLDAAAIEEKGAHEEFRAALVADPVFGAFIRFRAARATMAAVSGELVNVHNRLDRPAPRIPTQFRDSRLLDDLVELTDREAQRIAADEIDDFHVRREAAGEGAG